MPKPSSTPANQISEKKVALLVSTFAVTAHVIWSAMVALGFAQTYVNWMLGMHFISAPTVTIGAFDIATAITLIISVAVIGYIVGWVFAFVWNKGFKKFA